jgi:hypothetical protein
MAKKDRNPSDQIDAQKIWREREFFGSRHLNILSPLLICHWPRLPFFLLNSANKT